MIDLHLTYSWAHWWILLRELLPQSHCPNVHFTAILGPCSVNLDYHASWRYLCKWRIREWYTYGITNGYNDLDHYIDYNNDNWIQLILKTKLWWYFDELEKDTGYLTLALTCFFRVNNKHQYGTCLDYNRHSICAMNYEKVVNSIWEIILIHQEEIIPQNTFPHLNLCNHPCCETWLESVHILIHQEEIIPKTLLLAWIYVITHAAKLGWNRFWLHVGTYSTTHIQMTTAHSHAKLVVHNHSNSIYVLRRNILHFPGMIHSIPLWSTKHHFRNLHRSKQNQWERTVHCKHPCKETIAFLCHVELGYITLTKLREGCMIMTNFVRYQRHAICRVARCASYHNTIKCLVKESISSTKCCKIRYTCLTENLLAFVWCMHIWLIIDWWRSYSHGVV